MPQFDRLRIYPRFRAKNASMDTHPTNFSPVNRAGVQQPYLFEHQVVYAGDHLQPADGSGVLSHFPTAEARQPLKPTLTKDGLPAKRRGPKPDSKPAMTKRQQMNRQAQRSHRERKEHYIKSLEQEVLELKQAYEEILAQKVMEADENRALKNLLVQHNINVETMSPPPKFEPNNSISYGPSSTGSVSGGHPSGQESATFSPTSSMTSITPGHQPGRLPSDANMAAPQWRAPIARPALDYDAVGMDFVLNLEKPCVGHMQYLMVRAHNHENQPHHHPGENSDDSAFDHSSGHALMASSIPFSHIMKKPAEHWDFQLPKKEMMSGLAHLLKLSGNLPLNRDGEVTPIMAWSWIYNHERRNELTTSDLESIVTSLSTKVQCYGFGAVMEEFELVDAVSTVLASKDIPTSLTGQFAQQMISV